MAATTNVTIPSRFESILARDLEPAPLILAVESDLAAINRAREVARLQGGGVIAFLLGETGSGKTTAAYSASAHIPDAFGPVIPVPHDLPLRTVYGWLATNLPPTNGLTHPVLLDGREVTDDSIGLRQLMASTNALLRLRPDVVLLWPTTDEPWHKELRTLAERVGGTTLVPSESDISIAGPPRELWLTALERLLVQLDQRLDDLALERTTLEELVPEAATLGEFLQRVGALVLDRVQAVQLARQLPTLTFVVTSTSGIGGEANRIRRAATYFLKGDELLGYSRRSRAGLWWIERNKTAQHHLGYVISLFQARLVTMTPSPVVYAGLDFGDEEIRSAIRATGMRPIATNADRTIRSTDFFRLVANLPSPELTATPKGKTAPRTESAYAVVQGLSRTKHKAINQAICALMERNVPSFRASLGNFEVDQGERQVYSDAVIPTDIGDMHLEFHHIAEPSVAAMSAYIMGKLQEYAIRYNIIPR
jgi:hypothetical protein